MFPDNSSDAAAERTISVMKRLAAVALALATALPACAQHRGGGGHAGFGGHGSFAGRSAPAARSVPAFHGSFTPSPGFRYSGRPIARPGSSYPLPMRTLRPPVRYPAAPPINRPAFYQNHHPIMSRWHFYSHSYPYYSYGYYPSAIYIPYGFYDYGDFDSTDQPAPPSDYNAQPFDYGYQQPAPQTADGYPGSPGYQVYVPAASSPQMQYIPGSSEQVILIYKDGRPPEEIQNYLATRTTLTVLDGGRRRVVSVSDLNLPATIRANRETGVELKLPSVPGTTGCTGICAPSPGNP